MQKVAPRKDYFDLIYGRNFYQKLLICLLMNASTKPSALIMQEKLLPFGFSQKEEINCLES